MSGAGTAPGIVAVPVRQGPLAHAVSFELAREAVRFALSGLVRRMAALESAKAPAPEIEALRAQAASLAGRLRALRLDDEGAMQALVADCAALRGNGS